MPWSHRVAIALPLAWLVGCVAIPMAFLFGLSFAEVADAIPPVRPLLEVGARGPVLHITTQNLTMLVRDPLYLAAFANGIGNALATTLFCVLVGYPIAYAIARAPQPRRRIYVLLAVLPFWTSFLMRTYAWMGLIGDSGPITRLLEVTGLVEPPAHILYSPSAVLLVMVYSYIPFFILPMYSVLERLPLDLDEAAADLGARPWYRFWTVTLPLSLPGLAAGAILVFVPAVGEYIIPDLVGNSDTLMIGGVLWNVFFQNRDWPLASGIAFATMVLLVAPFVILRQAVPGLRAEASL